MQFRENAGLILAYKITGILAWVFTLLGALTVIGSMIFGVLAATGDPAWLGCMIVTAINGILYAIIAVAIFCARIDMIKH